uniref:Transcription repressor n=1 Tax=Leersia perrieri TaxID=77586 RepID=A0A0D9XX30_9ORYZ
MSSTAASRNARRGGGRHFPVGGGGARWRHVPVVDTGCGCRPRRPRQLLMSLPSFLRPSSVHTKPPLVPRSTSSTHSAASSSTTFFPSSASTASSSAATFTTTYSSSSNYAPPPVKSQPSSSPSPAAARRRKKRYEKMGNNSEEEEVGMAVEKESSDPRADFRESMVQMVVEMGMCGWDDLRCMLRRLLALNAPRHHAAILTAFAEVCAQLAAPPPPPPPPQLQPAAYHHYNYYQYHY